MRHNNSMRLLLATRCVSTRFPRCLCLVAVLLYLAAIIPLRAEPLQCQKEGVLDTKDGEVTFALMLQPKDSGTGNEPDCRISAQALQHFLMVETLVERLNTYDNNTGFIPGVKIGFTTYTSCGESLVSARNVITYLNSSLATLSSTCPKEQVTTPKIGIIGPSSSSTSSVVASLTKNLKIPVISPFVPLAGFSDKSLFPSVLRTVPSDVQQMTLIVDMLKELRWTYIAVAYQDNDYGKSGKQLLTQTAKKQGICVNKEDLPISGDYGDLGKRFEIILEGAKGKSMAVVVIAGSKAAEYLMYMLKLPESPSYYQKGLRFVLVDAVNTDVTVFKDGKKGQGTLTVSLGSGSLDMEALKRQLNQRFQTQASQPSFHPLVKEYIEEFQKYNPKDPRPDVLVTREVDAFLPATVNAVLTLAQGLRRQHRTTCRQRHGLCDDLKRDIADGKLLDRIRSDSVDYQDLPNDVIIPTLDNHPFSFSFDNNGDFQVTGNNVLYTVHSYDEDSNAYHLVGDYSNKQMHLDVGKIKWGDDQEVPTSMCVGDRCNECRDTGVVPITFLEGEVYIVGIFSLHESDPDDPFKCGPYRRVAHDALALESFLFSIRKLRETTGIKFGAIVFDACYSQPRILGTLTSYFSSMSSLYTQMFPVIVPREKVLGVVGCLSSDCTVVATPFFTALNLPVVSYASSSPDLDDRIDYPYFLRTVPSDEYQARVMVEIIKKMGWEYVGLLYVNNNYGAKGMKAFRRIVDVEGSGICAAKEIPISSKETMSNSDLFAARQNLTAQNVKVVVFFGIDTRFTDFVKNLRDFEPKSNRRFIILASEDWGDNENIKRAGDKGGENAARGALTLKLKGIDMEYEDELKSHLHNLDLRDNTTSAWFAEFWQKRFQCRIRGGFHDSWIGERSSQARRECLLSPKLGEQSEETVKAGVADQRTRHTVSAVMAMGKGLESIKQYCKGGLASCDFLQSNPRVVVEAIKRQTRKDGVDDVNVFDKDGNGAIGFDVYNIQWNGSAYVYVKVGTFGPRTPPGRELNVDRIKFYDGNGLEVSSYQATCGETQCMECRHRQSPNPPPLPMEDDVTADSVSEYRDADILVISLVAVLILAVLVLVAALVVCYRRKCQVFEKKISRDDPIYDEPIRQVYPGHTLPREGNLLFSIPDISPYVLNGTINREGVTNPTFLSDSDRIESVSQVMVARGLSVDTLNSTSVAGNISRQSSVIPQTSANHQNGRPDQCQSPVYKNMANLKLSTDELHNSTEQREPSVVYAPINAAALQHGSSTPGPQASPDQPQSTDSGNVVIARGPNGQLMAYMLPANDHLQQATSAHPQVVHNAINPDHGPYSRAAALQHAQRTVPVANSDIGSYIYTTGRPADSTASARQAPTSQILARSAPSNPQQQVAYENLAFTNLDQQPQQMLPVSHSANVIGNPVQPQSVNMTNQPRSAPPTAVQSPPVQYTLIPTHLISRPNDFSTHISATNPPAQANPVQQTVGLGIQHVQGNQWDGVSASNQNNSFNDYVTSDPDQHSQQSQGHERFYGYPESSHSLSSIPDVISGKMPYAPDTPMRMPRDISLESIDLNTNPDMNDEQMQYSPKKSRGGGKKTQPDGMSADSVVSVV